MNNTLFQLSDMIVPAYLDAGTGSLIFQVLVASLVSASVVFGGLMTRIRNVISRVLGRKSTTSEEISSSTTGIPSVEGPIKQQSLSKSHRKAA